MSEGVSLPDDRIILEGLIFYGFHGVNPAETESGQRFVIDVTMYQDLRAAGRSDDLNDTTNYSAVYRLIEQIVTGTPCRLLEHLAEKIARSILGATVVRAVTVRVRKPWAPIKGSVLDFVAVEIMRQRDEGKI